MVRIADVFIWLVTCILFLDLDCGDLVASNKYHCFAECEDIKSTGVCHAYAYA